MQLVNTEGNSPDNVKGLFDWRWGTNQFFAQYDCSDRVNMEGWWEVRLRASCLGEGGARTFQVVSPEYQSERWAPPCELRPLWRFVREGHWQAVAPRDLNVFEELRLS